MSTMSPTDISAAQQGRAQDNELVVGGRRYVLSPHAAAVLGDLVTTLESGKDVEIRTVEASLSTQEVAVFLGISRPSVIRLLDKGELAYEQPAGVHRRILRSELDRYMSEQVTKRRAALQDLADTYTPAEATMDGFVNTR